MQRQRRAKLWLASLSLLLCLVTLGDPAAAQQRPLSPLSQVKSWGYQLQHLDVAKAAESPYDVIVIDYSKDGSNDEALKPAELAQLKRKPDGTRRIVLSYLSIGEAESYRYYWQWTWGGTWYTNWIGWFMAPSWRGPVNREWAGNFATRFWQDGWQNVILGQGGYLDRILKAGFDGVYLDKIDSSIEAIAKNRPSARDDMRTFVGRIAERGRAVNPGFMVVPQNGEELLPDAAYRQIIDGLGKEDLLFGEFKDKRPNPSDVIEKRKTLLKLLMDEKKPVLAVEYIDDAAEIAAARRTLTELGFVAHFADRPLDNLRIGDLPPPGRSEKGGRFGRARD